MLLLNSQMTDQLCWGHLFEHEWFKWPVIFLFLIKAECPVIAFSNDDYLLRWFNNLSRLLAENYGIIRQESEK